MPVYCLPDDWESDNEPEDRPAAARAAVKPHRTLTSKPALSKATELLQRVAQASSNPQSRGGTRDEPLSPTYGQEPPRRLPAIAADEDLLGQAADLAMLPAGPGKALLPLSAPSRPATFGVFDDTELPRCSDADVRRWANAAPLSLGHIFSFRASMHGSLLALPVAHESTGVHRVKLMQLQPHMLKRRDASCSDCNDTIGDASKGIGLLEAQVQVGFAASHDQDNPVLEPRAGSGGKLLERLAGAERAEDLNIDLHTREAIGLLEKVVEDTSQDGHASAAVVAQQQRPARSRRCADRLSSWMAQVNARSVGKRLAQRRLPEPAGLLDLATTDADSADAAGPRLLRVFHLLTANSVRGALQELDRASTEASGSARFYYDRLAAIIASGGGSSAARVLWREGLRQQVEEWHVQGVHELMGTGLWRIYCLLAGKIDEIVADTLDWRTGLGMYVWYRGQPQTSHAAAGEEEDLSAAVRDFEVAVKKHGSSCCFRPAPLYARVEVEDGFGMSMLRKPSDARQEPKDLQYNIIRAAVGHLKWEDLQSYDYPTYTLRPLEVARSWHVAVAVLACRQGDTSSRDFQALTQQYCFLLELAGHWKWAVYVAQFISNAHARNAALRGLLLRGKVRTEAQVPEGWWWRCQALRSERQCDWVSAVGSWLACGDKERALMVALGCGLGEVVRFLPMAPPASWLLAALEDLEEWMVERPGAERAKLGGEALAFMRRWSVETASNYESQTLIGLYRRCEDLRRQVLGLPW